MENMSGVNKKANIIGSGLDTESVIEYPCVFPLKIFGETQNGFAQAVLAIIRKHAPDYDAATLEMKPSKQGKYLSLTCTINATSRQQLDAIYQELSDHPAVVMVL